MSSSGKALIFYGRFIVDIGDQRSIEQGFRLCPEIVPCASFAHGLLKVDGVEDLDPIPFSLQELSAFDEDTALWGQFAALTRRKKPFTAHF